MSEEILNSQEDIRRQIDEAHRRLHELENAGSDSVEELKTLTHEQEKYFTLDKITSQLDRLEALGGGDLFWGEDYDKAVVTEHTQTLKNLVTDFDERFNQVQQTKQNAGGESAEGLTARINFLNEELLHLQMEEQEQKQEVAEEFIVEREITKLPFRTLNMPWNRGGKGQKEFRKILLIVLFFTGLLGALIPMWKLPVPDRIEVVEVPKRLAKMMLAKKIPPPPPPKVKKKEKKEEKKDEKKKEKEVEKKKVEKKIEKPKPEKVKQPTPEPVITKRKKAESAGLMAFKDDFADLISDNNDVKLGASAKISGKGKGSKAKKATRSLVTAGVSDSSGGINTAELSRAAGGGGKNMANVGLSRVKSSIGEGKFAGDDRPLSGDGTASSRTDEEIQIVFDRYKAALYRIYNRELRKNPTLQGKMVLRLTIEPDGKVSACSVDSSDMDAPGLGDKISARVKRFKFGAKAGVPTVTILYPIDFLPAF